MAALTDPRVVIFGGTRGLGLAVARKLVADGAAVLVASRARSSVDRALAALSAEPSAHPPLAVRCDVSRQDDVTAAVGTAVAAWGGIDAVVNSAGVLGPAGPTDAVDWAAWRSAIETNVFGAALVARAVVPHFRAAGRGKLVLLSGGGATRALPGLSSYCASKAAVVRLVETLAKELTGTGVDVNAVAPGPLDTDMLADVVAAGPEAVGREYHDQVLRWQREGATPLDVPVSLITFLISPASDGVSGRLLSAVWDPWDDPARLAAALRDDDMFMLRRVDSDRRTVAAARGHAPS